MKIGFDNDKYLELQAQHIRERMSQFGGKLYLEFGGKLFDDHHASRVLPGFQPDSKIRMLATMKDDVEIVMAICAGDIEKNKMRGDLGISYDDDVLRLIDVFRGARLLCRLGRHHAVRRAACRRRVHQPPDGARREELPPLPHRGLPLGRGAHRLRRRAR